jgi:iron complex transport system substrate-binding protein
VLALWTSAAGCAGEQATPPATPEQAPAVPHRIVSLSPNVTETLFAVGAGEQLAAVTDFCNYPPDPLADMPRIGAYLNPDIERMLFLSPDLVVVLPSQVGTRERMEATGIATLTVRNESLDEILASIETLGEATGHGDEGRALAAELRAEMDAVRAQVADRAPVSVLLVIGRGADDLTGIFGVGPGTFLDEVIRTAGGRNVLAEAPTLYPQVPLEEVIRLAPQVIVEVVVPPSQLEPGQVSQAWSSLSSIPAVKDGRIHVLTEDYLLIPGPRAVRSAKRLLPLLHPETEAETEGAR